ncbi:hypothetical protein Tcan_04418 [Toxocara canis]|uniref:Three prime repair exonuclease 1 n=1 Tax=Toxocara canis TaxID=6265 RepID=A0A0B2VRK5_TOXCA|nr:hypothetical protein Tcan_04418 [Toxocara canis]
MSADEQRPPAPIQTYVMLDFETTGLFPSDSLNPMNDRLLPGDPNRNPRLLLTNYIRMTSSRCAPQIVELSAVSTSRSQILLGISEMFSLSALEDESDESGEKPQQFVIRIPCNVHTRQVKPNLIEKEWNDYETRRNQCQAVRLTRAALEEKNNFADEWKGLQLFLEQMPKPVCIIAHNGIRFDFRVLFAELERHNLLKSKPMPEQVYFVDSYLMFLDLEKKHHDDLRSLTQLVDWSKLTGKLSRPPKVNMSRNEDTITSATPPTAQPTRSEEEGKEINADSGAVANTSALTAIEKGTRSIQFSTPPAKATKMDSSVESPCSAKRRLFDIADDHPLKFMRISKWSPAKKRRVRSNFFSRLNDGDWVFDGHVSMQYFREKGVFKLEQMYKELINGPFDAHFAQDDCEALLQVCMAYGQEFIDYVDAKAAPFPFDIVTANNNP